MTEWVWISKAVMNYLELVKMLEEIRRNEALRIITKVKGEHVDNVGAGIFFDLKQELENNVEIILKIFWDLENRSFELIEILSDGESKMEQYKNHLIVKKQLEHLNQAYSTQ